MMFIFILLFILYISIVYMILKALYLLNQETEWEIKLQKQLKELEDNYYSDFGDIQDDILEIKDDLSDIYVKLQQTDKNLIEIMYKNVKIHEGSKNN